MTLLEMKPPAALPKLTPREQQIYALLCEGIAPVDIAERLMISKRTVDFHTQNLYDKCQVSNCQQLLANEIKRLKYYGVRV